MANHQRDPRKEQTWRKHIEAWKDSGLSVRDFCRRHQIPEASFYYWRTILAERDTQPDITQADHDNQPTSPMPLFLPLNLRAEPQPVTVVLTDGTRLHVPHDFDADSLRRLLAVLRGVPC